MIILIDIGNSTLKWALVNNRSSSSKDNAQYIETYGNNSISYRNGDIENVITDLINAWKDLELEPSKVLISNVGCARLAEELDDAIWFEYEVETEYLKSSRKYKSLQNCYLKPSQLGVDRWLNLIGAYELSLDEGSKQAFCVIDCGTAITIDVVNKQHCHIGGFIIPGIELMTNCLLDNTAQIKSNLILSKKLDQIKTHNVKSTKNSQFIESVLANNTEHGIKGGIYYCVVAYIERILEDLSDMRLGEYKVYLTGGDAHKLYNMLKIDNVEASNFIVLDSDLIWQGMASFI